MKKLLLLVSSCLFGVLLCGQTPGQTPQYPSPAFAATKTTALSGTAEVITVQKPAAGDDINFYSGYVYCSVACTVQIERDGTAATATTLAIRSLAPTGAATTATAWSGSNVGAGTLISPVYVISAGGSLIFDLSNIWLTGKATANNLTFRTNSITGTAQIAVVWRERR